MAVSRSKRRYCSFNKMDAGTSEKNKPKINGHASATDLTLGFSFRFTLLLKTERSRRQLRAWAAESREPRRTPTCRAGPHGTCFEPPSTSPAPHHQSSETATLA